MTEYTIFFDDGGVLNDNSNDGRAAKWKDLIYQYFGKRYGGSRDQWSEANTKALTYVIDQLNNSNFYTFREYQDHVDYKFIEIMFNHMQLPIPDDPIALRRDADGSFHRQQPHSQGCQLLT